MKEESLKEVDTIFGKIKFDLNLNITKDSIEYNRKLLKDEETLHNLRMDGKDEVKEAADYRKNMREKLEHLADDTGLLLVNKKLQGEYLKSYIKEFEQIFEHCKDSAEYSDEMKFLQTLINAVKEQPNIRFGTVMQESGGEYDKTNDVLYIDIDKSILYIKHDRQTEKDMRDEFVGTLSHELLHRCDCKIPKLVTFFDNELKEAFANYSDSTKFRDSMKLVAKIIDGCFSEARLKPYIEKWNRIKKNLTYLSLCMR